MWQEWAQSRCRCGSGGSGPGADVGRRCRCGQGWARSRSRCGSGGPVPVPMWVGQSQPIRFERRRRMRAVGLRGGWTGDADRSAIPRRSTTCCTTAQHFAPQHNMLHHRAPHVAAKPSRKGPGRGRRGREGRGLHHCRISLRQRLAPEFLGGNFGGLQETDRAAWDTVRQTQTCAKAALGSARAVK
jgi:hypothetical protein